MTSMNGSTRRALLSTLAALPVGVGASSAERLSTLNGGAARVLVAYFSRTGNTRVIAGLIQRSLKASLFEIQPAKPYPEDYLETVEQARLERDAGQERPLAQNITLQEFNTVFLGFPIWGETVPPVVRTFLASHNWEGKSLIPFLTHGGYGSGNSKSVLEAYLSKGILHPGFAMQADQERQTMTQVGDWLKAMGQRS